MPVKEGDIFAHWQPGSRPSGPIPQNIDREAVDGQSTGKGGFGKGDLEVGQVISMEGFTGSRDYAINVILLPDSSH